MKRQNAVLYIRIDEKMKTQLKEKADKIGLSLSAYIKMKLREILKED